MKKLILLCIIATSVPCWAIPQLINYQGYLTRPDETPLDTVVAVTFALYSNSTGGTAIWAETQPACVVQAGHFDVQLGSSVVLPDNFQLAEIWLGVQVGSDAEMVPRSRLTSVPYAYRIGTIDGASGGVVTGDATIIGKGTIGVGNVNSGVGSFVAGEYDTVTANYATIGGGTHNLASSINSTVGGGTHNTASGGTSTVGGGSNNTSSGPFAAIGGGINNAASGWGAMIPGGVACGASGGMSFAGGYRARAIHENSFVWADGQDNDYSSDGVNSFNVRAFGGVKMYTSAAGGAQLPAGSSAWVAISDSTKKADIQRVDTKDVLEKIRTLPISKWRYKDQPDQAIRHIGPMAQDFWSAFHLGEDSLGISTIDPDGVALAAIQELAKRNQELETRVKLLEAALLEYGFIESNKLK